MANNSELGKRIKSEQGLAKPVRNENLVCRDCLFRHDDRIKIGNTTSCDMYPDHTKPNSIVFGGDKCKLYKKEVKNG